MSFWDESKPDDGPPPRVTQTTVLAVGFALFVLASIWPPLLLVVAFLLSQLLPYSLRVNDDPESRRKFYREFQKRAVENKAIPSDWKETPKDIVLKERYWVNDRGMCLMTTILEPSDRSKIRAVVCYCHGYGDNGFAYMKRTEYYRYVRAGIAVINMEIEGHGRSDGLLGHVPCFEKVVDDTSSFFREVLEKKFPGKKYFLAGESMGGAICLKTYNRNPNLWSGVVFLAPMCKIADNMMPPEFVTNAFKRILGPSGTVSLLGELPVAPAKGHPALLSFKLVEKRRLYTMHPFIYGRKPRLDTAREVLDLTADISNNLLKEFDAPFLVQHGSRDMVTCPKLSQMLYEESPSKDKEIQLYDGMWHALTSGEPDENAEKVFNDSIKWILDRAK